MKLGELSQVELRRLAANGGLRYRSGPFNLQLRTELAPFLDTLQYMYPGAPLLDEAQHPCHFHITLNAVGGWRRWLRPQVQFWVDGFTPFDPYPLDQAFPMYEWGLNWCIGTTAHQNLMLHSAVVEKNGQGLILPAMPGSGKSTLCAGLVSRGWRLLSDEFGILRHSDGQLLPLPRAAPLKNASIPLMQVFAPDQRYGPRFDKTRKGLVVHLAPPPASLADQDLPATPRWIIFPRYSDGGVTQLVPQPRALAFTRLINNSFNYLVTLEQGFQSLTRLVHHCDCYQLENGSLEAAIEAVETLAEGGSQ